MFLSDPGIPGVRSMGLSLSKYKGLLEILAKLAKLAILAILAKLAILAILANLRFINTSASQSSGG